MVLGPDAWTLRADFVPADTANYTSTSATVTLNVRYATGDCLGTPERTALSPLDADGTSVFEQGRTAPIKFRVCVASGHAIGTPGVVADFKLVQISTGTASQAVNEPVDSTTPDAAFRWDAHDQQWIFNLNTKPLAAGATYTYRITLNDGTAIVFAFSLR
jgi:hypothetical protein